ncbi:MAG: 3-isopropylmalate dehydratase small subunit [Beijerinckiaceae bacterium]|nr:3-isopropylmalate dehydratase small subunit [Beijerinckiaceae bacterium]MCZ8299964.1 3-isopropylmalate dehydratase small subunit [Beijerinckiaceae bacterium]
MERFIRLDARACPLGLANVDTDQLIPARFMSRPRSEGYGRFLLHDLRFGPDGQSLGFALDDARHAGTGVIAARRNFGTGSSREAAVYALWDYGIRCVIAPSFGDIFASNAVKNGLLPAQVSPEDAEAILASLEAAEVPHLVVDLETLRIEVGGRSFAFAIDAVRRLQLLNGWDDLDLTRRHAGEIAAFRTRRLAEAPWLLPG